MKTISTLTWCKLGWAKTVLLSVPFFAFSLLLGLSTDYPILNYIGGVVAGAIAHNWIIYFWLLKNESTMEKIMKGFKEKI